MKAFAIVFSGNRSHLNVEKQRVKNNCSVDLLFLGEHNLFGGKVFLGRVLRIHFFVLPLPPWIIQSSSQSLPPSSSFLLSPPSVFPSADLHNLFLFCNACWNCFLFLYTKIQKIHLYRSPAASRPLIKQLRSSSVPDRREVTGSGLPVNAQLVFLSLSCRMRGGKGLVHYWMSVFSKSTATRLFLFNIKKQTERVEREDAFFLRPCGNMIIKEGK